MVVAAIEVVRLLDQSSDGDGRVIKHLAYLNVLMSVSHWNLLDVFQRAAVHLLHCSLEGGVRDFPKPLDSEKEAFEEKDQSVPLRFRRSGLSNKKVQSS